MNNPQPFDRTESFVCYNSNLVVDFLKLQKENNLTSALNFEDAKKDAKNFNEYTVLYNTFKDRIEAEYLNPDSYTGGSKYSIYRKTPNQQYYDFVCELPEGQYIMKDYNIVNDVYYHYLVTVETKTYGSPEITFFENTNEDSEDYYVHANWWKWSLCDIEPTDDETVYTKTGSVWKFAYNMEAGTYTTNTSVSSWDTLGQYGKFSIGQKNYDSSTFSCLLGDMDEYYDYDSYLSRAQGDYGDSETKVMKKFYKYTERENILTREQYDTKKLEMAENPEAFQNWVTQQLEKNKYSREVEKTNSWRKFVTDGKLKLLKDYKGNSWVIQIMPNSQRIVNLQSNYQQTTISFEWMEAMDINDISIITVGE